MVKITRKEFQKLIEATLDDADFDDIVNAELEDKNNVTADDVQQRLEDKAAEIGASISDEFDTADEIENKLSNREELSSSTSFSVTEISRYNIRNIINEELLKLVEDKSGKGECPDSGCITQHDDKWRIISNKTGKLWSQTYDSKGDAKDALDAYHVSK